MQAGRMCVAYVLAINDNNRSDWYTDDRRDMFQVDLVLNSEYHWYRWNHLNGRRNLHSGKQELVYLSSESHPICRRSCHGSAATTSLTSLFVASVRRTYQRS